MAPSNVLPIYGNEKSMNLNSLVLKNIQESPYFKHKLYTLVTYHQVVQEILITVNHLEPWEKGSRNTSNQVGMCGGVRGVGTGGIVSSAYCLLYKLYTQKITRNQLNALCSRTDSPFIRGLGLIYIRYTQPPDTFWDWYEQFLDDEEEIDPKAGGGHIMTIGEMVQNLLSKLDWYDTVLPRIPIPIQKDIDAKLKQFKDQNRSITKNKTSPSMSRGEERRSRDRSRDDRDRSVDNTRMFHDDRDRSRDDRYRSRDDRDKSRDDRDRSRDERKKKSRDRSRSRSRHHDRKSNRHRSTSKEKKHHIKKSKRHRSRSKDIKKDKHHKKSRRHSRSSSRNPRYEKSCETDNFQKDLQRELDRLKKDKI